MLLSFDLDVIPYARLIGYVSYNEPWSHFSRTINEYILYIVKGGEMYIREGDNQFVLRKGDMLILEPNLLHVGYKAATCDYYYIHFSHSGIKHVIGKPEEDIIKEIVFNRKLSITSDLYSNLRIVEPPCYIPKYYHFENESLFLYNLNEVLEDFSKKYENFKKVAALRLMDFFIRISREYITTSIEIHHKNFPKSLIKVHKILDYLNSNYRTKLTGNTLAVLFESNYNYLNRIFLRITGYTIFKYLSIIRINKAKELIATTTMTFSEIGYQVGIDDPYYFSKLFKKNTGMTPTQYCQNKIDCLN